MGFLSKLFGNPSLEQFAHELERALRASGVRDPISVDTTTGTMRLGEASSPRLLQLTNFYHQFLQTARKERHEFLASVVRRFRTMETPTPASFHEARLRLLPSIRSRCHYAFSNLMLAVNRSGDQESTLRPFRLLNDHLAFGLVLDYDETMRMVTHDDLQAWGVEEQTALETAIANLEARTEPQFREKSGVWISTWEDSYDATRMLLPDLITALPVKGRHTILMPNRNCLLVTGDMDPAGLKAMAEMASDALDEPQPISATPLVWDGSWTGLALRADHPAAQAFALIRMQQLAGDYGQQKELLDALEASRGEDIFYATFMARQQEKTGELASYATWTEDVAQCLPEADRVVFVRDGADNTAGFALWSDVVRVMGAAVEPTDHYPRRFITHGFPTDEQMRAMGVRPF